jgi:hypothetical protein
VIDHPTGGPELRHLEDRVNEEIVSQGWRFGPARLTGQARCSPATVGSVIATDERGGRVLVQNGDQISARGIANQLRSYHRHSMVLAGEVTAVRHRLARAFCGMTPDEVDAIVVDHMDGQRDRFMVIGAFVTLLSPSLDWKPTLMVVKPYDLAQRQPSTKAVIETQRRRLRTLGDRTPRDVLTACPLTASRMLGAHNPVQQAALAAGALEDLHSADIVHFADGRLVNQIELAPGVTWLDGTLRMPDVPDTVLMALKGARAAAVIAHPHMPADAVITGARRRGRRVHVDVEVATVPFASLMDDLLERAERVEPGARARMLDMHARLRGVVEDRRP